jgi:hypothetical protein
MRFFFGVRWLLKCLAPDLESPGHPGERVDKSWAERVERLIAKEGLIEKVKAVAVEASTLMGRSE